jgi:hypothetical protein
MEIKISQEEFTMDTEHIARRKHNMKKMQWQQPLMAKLMQIENYN